MGRLMQRAGVVILDLSFRSCPRTARSKHAVNRRADVIDTGDNIDVKRDMAVARRMLASEFPWENLTTQFSARIPGEQAFWIAGPECPEGALPEDASKVGLDGKVITQGAEPVVRAGLHAA